MSRTDEDSRQFPYMISMEKPSPFILHFLGPVIQHFKHWNVHTTPTPIWHTAKKNVRVDE